MYPLGTYFSIQDAALDDTGEDSLPNKPEQTDGDDDDDATKNEDEAEKKGVEDDKDGADKDETDGAKKEDELQKNGVVKTKPRINYQAKWRGAGRAVLMSKRGFKGPPGTCLQKDTTKYNALFTFISGLYKI